MRPVDSTAYDGILNGTRENYDEHIPCLDEAGLEQKLQKNVEYWQKNLENMKVKNKQLQE